MNLIRSLGAVLALAITAAAAPAFALSPADEALVGRANEYFDQVHTLKARFVQEAANGAESEGMLYLNRPGKLRLEYAPPTPILVVAEGDSLVYYDSSLQQVSYVDLDSTMAGVLVSPHVQLDGGSLKVIGVGHQPSTTIITVAKRDDPRQGKIALVFSEKPFELRQWQVTDQQGLITTVTLYDAQSGMPLDAALFEFHDPRPNPGTNRPR